MKPLVDEAWLSDRLVGGLWAHIQTLAETGSTNADLAARARAGAPSGTALVCDHQTRGRGRFTRPWQAPPGSSVAISLLLRPDQADVRRWLWLPLLTGLAVADALRSSAHLDPVLKWPNDVLLGDGKVCGILTERVETPLGAAVVIGLGINTRMTAEQAPVPTATSLALAGSSADTPEVVLAVLQAFEGWYRRWAAGEDLRHTYARSCGTVGRRVRVVVSQAETVEGEAVGVDDDGRLLLQVDGGVRAFAAGDVWHLR